jgi:alpha-galactosidase
MRLIILGALLSICIISVSSINNGLGMTPPMGWNSWNKFSCNIDEDLIKQTALLLKSTGLAAKGYKYVNIDDCWQKSRDQAGRIVEDPVSFPNGIKALSDFIHNEGLLFGLYSSAGTLTCQGRPGGLDHEAMDAQSYASWDVDYLKYDNCYNEGESGKDIRYPAMRDALNKTGRPIFYSLCNWGEEDTATWAADVGNSWRTTGDIEDNWESFVNILDQQYGLEKYAGRGKGWNDPDMLEIGNGGMTVNEYQSHFALWALLKSPLLIGCDLQKLTPEILNILGNEHIIAVNQDSLGIQGKRVSRRQADSGLVEVYSGPVTGGIVMILFNRGSKTESITADFKECGFKYAGGNVFDLITGEEKGFVAKEYTADVASHSVVVIKLKAYCLEGVDDCRGFKFLEE